MNNSNNRRRKAMKPRVAKRRSRISNQSLNFECLEDRVLLAGLTVNALGGQDNNAANVTSFISSPISEGYASFYGPVNTTLGTSSIAGTIFNDENGNGVRENEELGQADVGVFLDANDNGVFDVNENITSTDFNGGYVFTDILPGDYIVRQIVPNDFQQTSPLIVGVNDRLFSAEGSRIAELDPVSGQEINSFFVNSFSDSSLAFDGSSLWLINSDFFSPESSFTVVGELDPDTGQVLNEFTLDGNIPQIRNAAFLNGNLYLNGLESDRLFVIDPATGEIVNEVQSVDGAEGLAGFASTNELVAISQGDLVFIDPETGNVNDRFSNLNLFSDGGLAVVGDEVYVGNFSQVLRFNRDGEFLGALATSSFGTSLAGDGIASEIDNAHRVMVEAATPVDNLDFGNQSILTSISGTIFNDENGDGIRDDGELGQAGVVVFLDANDNGVFDDNENVIATDSDGGYVFTDILPGDYIVREIVPNDFQQTSPLIVGVTDRLFSAEGSRIAELDPVSGQEINSFFVNSFSDSSLAFDGSSLWLINSDFNSPESSFTVVSELNPDTGEVLNEFTLNENIPQIRNAAFLNGNLYLNGLESDRLFVIDPATGEIVNEVRSVDGAQGLAGFAATNELVAISQGDLVFIDPETGNVNDRFSNFNLFSDGGLAVVGDEVYVNDFSQILRFNRDGEFLGGLAASVFGTSLAGDGIASGIEDAHRVTVEAATPFSNLDFGNQSVLTSISGTIFSDDDGDGFRDTGERGQEGVVVFIDSNNNGVFDSNFDSGFEISTTTDFFGTYVFTDVLPGDYIVREIVPENSQQTSPLIVGVTDRLFAVDGSQIVELDPVSGQALNSFFVNASSLSSLAFDGSSLWLINSNSFSPESSFPVVSELDPDTGEVLNEFTLDENIPQISNAAFLNGNLYLNGFGSDRLFVIDPATGEILNSVRSVDGADGLAGFAATNELVTISQGDLVFIDPETGNVNDRFSNFNLSFGEGLAVVGDEVFLGAFPDVLRFNRDGELLGVQATRSFGTSLGGDGIASGIEDAHRVTVEAATPLDNLDFGNQSVLTSISGTIFSDDDGDGFRDTGERGQEGVVVYIDSNNNGVFDSSFDSGFEISTTTDFFGTYVFTDVLPGDYIVREIVPNDFQQTSPLIVGVTDRLFSVDGSQIVELDPVSGQALNSFFANASSSSSLAFDGSSLWLINSNSFSPESSFPVVSELDPDTGEVLNEFTLDENIPQISNAAFLNGNLYLNGFGSDRLFVIDPATGEILNSVRSVDGADGLAGFAATNELVAISQGELVFINPETGNVNDRFSNFNLSSGSGLAVVGDEVYVNDFSQVLRFNRDGEFLGAPAANSFGTSLGGDGIASGIEDAHRVTVEAATPLDNLDFGNQFFVQETPFLRGDVNQDGVVDFLDISSFISLLQSGDFLAEGDIDGSGEVDFSDITPFISLLSVASNLSSPLQKPAPVQSPTNKVIDTVFSDSIDDADESFLT